MASFQFCIIGGAFGIICEYTRPSKDTRIVSAMTIIIKTILIVLFVFILFALGSAMFYLVRGDNSERIVKALTWRIGLSLLLFVILMISFALGWITPNNI